ncbi:MAG TPA: class I SAM-dependent methyltransferase [Casimicrobiaceae bacterium]|nr:class I SAM-dependent methyltransferase [Casimicrobiaceae bacterium]
MNRRRFTAALALAGLYGLRGVASAQTAPNRAPDVPYEPSPPEAVRAMLELAKVGPNDVVYDLGSGDGRIVIEAAKSYGARGVGIDIDPKRIAEAKENALRAGVTSRVHFVLGDLFESDYSEATVVTLFLWPHINLKLRPQLRKLRPGTRIVSYVHDMGDWAPDRTVHVRPAGSLRERPIHLWTVPAG